MLRLDIPNPICNTDKGTVYLPESDTSKLYSFSFNYNVFRKTNNLSVTEFNITPKWQIFTCELRIQHSPDATPVTYSLGQIHYVLVFNPVPNTNNCLAGGGFGVFYGSPLISLSILLILTLLVTVPIIGYFLVRCHKKVLVTPIGEQNSLAVKIEDNIIEDEVKQKETSMDTFQDNGSHAQDKLNRKLPDTISSRDD